jgi:hypothetical protein
MTIIACPKLLFTATVLSGIALCANPALARGTSGAMNSAHQPTTTSGSHLSTQGMANTNGRYAADRDTGLDRAEDRMSATGRAHSHALKHHESDNDADDKPSTTTSTTRH